MASKTRKKLTPIEEVVVPVDSSESEVLGVKAEETEEPEVTIRHGIVTCPRLNVRQEPSKTSEVIKVVEKDTKFEILSENGIWFNVRLENGFEGFCMSKFIEVK